MLDRVLEKEMLMTKQAQRIERLRARIRRVEVDLLELRVRLDTEQDFDARLDDALYEAYVRDLPDEESAAELDTVAQRA